MNTEELLVFPNLEMGDNIVLNGMCRFLARQEKAIAWAARHDHIAAITRMFSDLPNVRTVLVNEYNYAKEYAKLGEEWARQIRIGYFSEAGSTWNSATSGHWDQKFYEEGRVDFDERWKSFSLPADLLRPQKRENFALIHQIPEREIVIQADLFPKNIPLVHIRWLPSFWDWMPSILSASELHFVDSSYLNLAESLYAIGLLRDTKLVFHSYAKLRIAREKYPVLRAPWEIL